MIAFINKEESFKVLKETCTIDSTSNGFVLNYGVSKEGPWTAWEKATPANEVCVVNGMTPYSYLKLIGNVDDNVKVIL